MEKLSDYWKTLKYDYIKTYSGFRGKKFEEFKLANQEKLKELKKQFEGARFMQKPKISKKINLIEQEINLHNARIFDFQLNLHKSAIEVTTKRKNDQFVIDLEEILSIEYKEDVATCRIPVFRDAIVFYSNENNIVGILQICFGCILIENQFQEELVADIKVFEQLAFLLKKEGHEIEHI